MIALTRVGIRLLITTAGALMIVNWALHLMVQFGGCS